ncbi:MAG TPA: Bax inhibitor-1 family protein [Chromobacteriaceae bacterium]|nr:Bax inhibitor-1 family protein [Chromobacteriaceae bacterium]
MPFEPSFAGVQAAPVVDRATFIRRTYLYLAGALGLFTVLCAAFVSSGLGVVMIKALSKTSYSWLLVLGAFMLVAKLATHLSENAASNSTQAIGLGLYVLAEALIFAPLLTLAYMVDPTIVPTAGLLTLMLTGGLTYTAFSTKSDFSFLAPILAIGSLVALGVIVCSVLFGFTLGIVFSGAMLLLAGGMILFDTSRIIRDYPADRPAGAALHLFASVALLFWYVVRILMQLQRR